MKQRIFLFLSVMFLTVSIVFAQSKTASGVVYEKETGLPVIGANIIVKGHNTIGTVTNLDGQFTILNIPKDAEELVISYVGMVSQTVSIKSNLKVYLASDSEQLEEVVVVGYGSGKKMGSVVSSVAVVKAKDLSAKPTANPFDAVAGKVAGLSIASSSGEPGTVSSVTLHGSGSLSAGTSPLYIVDGMPVGAGTVQSMNPNDFETLQVLKDAAATSIYGARAANGVIFITTKRGRTGERANVTFRSSYGISNLANRDYYDKMMTSRELIDFRYELAKGTDDSWENNFRNDEWREKYKLGPWTGGALPDNWREIYEQNEFYQPDGTLCDTNWTDYWYQKNRPTYSADVSVSGGGGRTTYFLSASIFHQDGLRYDSYYKKKSVRLNLRSQINKYMTIGTNNSVTSDDSRFSSSGFGGSKMNGGLFYLSRPYINPYDENGEMLVKNPETGGVSPKYRAEKIKSNDGFLSIQTSSFLEVKPFKGLTMKSQIGYQISDARGYSYRLPSYISNIGNGSRTDDFSKSTSLTNTNTLEYKFDIKNKHNFIVLLGHEFTDNSSEGFSASGSGLFTDNLVNLGQTTKEKNVDSSDSSSAFLSYFSRLSYSYADKYYVDLTYRNDASSRFAKNHRSASFWSMGLMWHAKQERMFRDIDWLSDLRVKYSVGTQGNASIGNYDAYQLTSFYGQYDGNGGLGISTPGNKDLTWEDQFSTSLGFEARLFDKLGVEFSAYHRLTSSMLMGVPLPYYTGYGSIRRNIGKYQNQGFDLKLDYDIIRNNKGDGLSAYFNINYNRDEVKSLFNGKNFHYNSGSGVAYVIGSPVMFFYPIYKGINTLNGMPMWYLPGETQGEKHTDDNDVTYRYTDSLNQNTGIRVNTPWTGGFGFNADYKGLYLQASFNFALGKHMITNDEFFSANPTVFLEQNQSRDVKDYWKNEGDVTKYPRLRDDDGDAVQFTRFDTRLIDNASFMRMKNITIGYQVPASFLTKYTANVIRGAKVYMSGRNLLTFTSYNGPDPEPNSNLSLGGNPNTKTISFGVELNF